MLWHCSGTLRAHACPKQRQAKGTDNPRTKHANKRACQQKDTPSARIGHKGTEGILVWKHARHADTLNKQVPLGIRVNILIFVMYVLNLTSLG